MRRLRFSIRTKVLFLLGTSLLIIFSIGVVWFVRNTVHSLRQNLTNEAQSFAALATEPIGKTFELYKDSGTVRIDQQVGQFTRLNPVITNIAVFDINGKVAYKQNSQVLPIVNADQASSFNREYIHGSNGQLLAIIQPFIEDNGIHRYNILYLVSNSAIEQNIRQGVLAILALAIMSMLLTGLVLYLAMNQFLLKPLSRVSHAALEISTGQLDKEIPEERHDEIGDLAQSVNSMAESLKADIAKLQEADKLKSEFMIIASHNLRTPLTIIEGYLDLLKDMKLPNEVQQMVTLIDTSSTQLSRLAEEILTTAQIEAGQKLGGNVELVDLVKVTSAVIDQHKPNIAKQGLSLHLDLPPQGLTVHAISRFVEQVIWNIMDNAIKFTEKGGSITIQLKQSNGNASLAIKDTGIGISLEEQSKLFTKFHRGTSVMEYNYVGTGLGLYISQLIINQFDGDISVQSELGKGSTFTIHFPLATGS